MFRRFSLIVGAGAVGIIGASMLVAQPRTAPPIKSGVVNAISDFADTHPDWQVLRDGRRDATLLMFNHAVHMKPDVVKVMAGSEGGAGGPMAVQHLPDGGLALTCASCHEEDSAGRYMKPIRFERHCVACHESNLQMVGDRRVPHGNVAQLIDMVNAYLLREQMEKSAQASAAGGPGETASGVRIVSATLADNPQWPWTRLASLQPPPAQAQPPRETNEQPGKPVDVDKVLSSARHRMFDQILDGCAQCHPGAALQRPRTPRGAPFEMAPPGIPQHWLEQSVFSHHAHRALTCLECHAGATSGEDTGDIMLPSIESCRKCHTPAAGVRSDCVMCHLYHPPLSPEPQGTLTIEEYASGPGKKQ